jgi:hypothetical protein
MLSLFRAAFCALGWRTIADHVNASSAHTFSSHEKTAEIPLSSSSVLGASRQHRTKEQRGPFGKTLRKGMLSCRATDANNPADAGF